MNSNEKMRIMYDDLIKHVVESGELSESCIIELNRYFNKAGLGNVTDYLVNEKIGKAFVINENYDDFKRRNPNFLEALKEFNRVCDQHQ